MVSRIKDIKDWSFISTDSQVSVLVVEQQLKCYGAGLEFGSTRFKQFPNWSGRYGGGSRGWFIYPTLRDIQPELTERWTNEMNDVVKVWGN
jgi:hypothetical protein